MSPVDWVVVIVANVLLGVWIQRMLNDSRKRERAMLAEYEQKKSSPQHVSLCGDQK